MSDNQILVICPICSRGVPEQNINEHLDNNCAGLGTTSTKKVVANSSTGTQQSLKLSSSKNKSSTSDDVYPLFKGGHNHQASTSKSTASHGASSPQDPQPNTASGSRKRELETMDTLTTQDHGTPKRFKPSKTSESAPLAEKLRPRTLSEFVGQEHLTGPNSLLLNLIASGSTGSIIFWGPPGCGKTTLARLLARASDAVFKELSATIVGINEVRGVFEEAKSMRALTGRKTILFLDEVHRFNKAQQDIFLPYVEQGHIQLIGATTENPSFKVNGALLSRCRVFVLERLTEEDIRLIVTRAIQRVSPEPTQTTLQTSDKDQILSSQRTIVCEEVSSSQISSDTLSTITDEEHPFPNFPQITTRVLTSIVSLSAGDARTALSLLELTLSSSPETDTTKLLNSLRRSVSTSYDRSGDSHYDMISALHKSVRASNGSAAMYWLARMLTAGEDPMYIARRMVVCASEDIGLADNHALPLAIAAMEACRTIGMPECRINLAHIVAYLSESPKSTRSYEAYKRAEAAAASDTTLPVPLAMRNAPTKLMKELGYARGYAYNPDYAHPVHNECLPIQFQDDVFLRKAGDLTVKIWDEDLLSTWELEENGGKEWEGRQSSSKD